MQRKMQPGDKLPDTAQLLRRVHKAIDTINHVLLGKKKQTLLAVTTLLSRGHLLIEDLPGMGKTTLALALARVFGLTYKRVQFTSDVLPADILGLNVYDKNTGEFIFHPGPIFSQLVLADEINRTTPKTQSALLEAMEEHQVTLEGQTRNLPEPFFVIATQNPQTQAGTFPLPESQLDRFLMRLELGYPDKEAERLLLTGEDRRDMLEKMDAGLTVQELYLLQKACGKVVTSDAILDYIQRIAAFTRLSEEFAYGLSPRGTMALLATSRSWAFLNNRTHVIPEDVQHVLPSVVVHRVREKADFSQHGGAALAQRILTQVDVLA